MIDAAEALERVRALHREVVVYEMDPANGYWVYEDDERKVWVRLCEACSSKHHAVIHPCETIRAIGDHRD